MGKISGFLLRQPMHALLLIPLAIFLWEFLPDQGQADDAYISYRYAQNLADGYGLVFNVGDRVEGYTNLLWTVLVAVGIKFGLSAPLAGHLLSVVSGLLCVISTYFFALSIIPRSQRYFAVLAPLALLSSSAFASWTASGLETPMFTAWVTFAFVFFIAGRIWLVVACCVLASLTRPEGLLLATVLIVADWLKHVFVQKPGSINQLVRASLPGFIFFLVVMAHTIFRLGYYGDWLPNTFRAKVGGIPVERGFMYAYNFLADGHWLLMIGALVAAITIPRYRLPFVFICLVTIYVISVGGDVFQFGRFFVPVLPLLIGGALAAIFIAAEKGGAVGTLFLTCTFLLFPFWCLYSYWPVTYDNAGAQRMSFPMSGKRLIALNNHIAFGGDAEIKAQADAVLAVRPPVQLVATIGLGRLGYFLGTLPVLDLVGLVDRHIARSERLVQGDVIIIPGHQRTDANYVFERNPDLIIIPRKEDAFLVNPAMMDLWNDPRFDARYYWDNKLGAYRRYSGFKN